MGGSTWTVREDGVHGWSTWTERRTGSMDGAHGQRGGRGPWMKHVDSEGGRGLCCRRMN